MSNNANQLLAEVSLYLSNLNEKDDKSRNSKFMKVYAEKLNKKINDYFRHQFEIEKAI